MPPYPLLLTPCQYLLLVAGLFPLELLLGEIAWEKVSESPQARVEQVRLVNEHGDFAITRLISTNHVEIRLGSGAWGVTGLLFRWKDRPLLLSSAEIAEPQTQWTERQVSLELVFGDALKGRLEGVRPPGTIGALFRLSLELPGNGDPPDAPVEFTFRGYVETDEDPTKRQRFIVMADREIPPADKQVSLLEGERNWFLASDHCYNAEGFLAGKTMKAQPMGPLGAAIVPREYERLMVDCSNNYGTYLSARLRPGISSAHFMLWEFAGKSKDAALDIVEREKRLLGEFAAGRPTSGLQKSQEYGPGHVQSSHRLSSAGRRTSFLLPNLSQVRVAILSTDLGYTEGATAAWCEGVLRKAGCREASLLDVRQFANPKELNRDKFNVALIPPLQAKPDEIWDCLLEFHHRGGHVVFCDTGRTAVFKNRQGLWEEIYPYPHWHWAFHVFEVPGQLAKAESATGRILRNAALNEAPWDTLLPASLGETTFGGSYFDKFRRTHKDAVGQAMAKECLCFSPYEEVDSAGKAINASVFLLRHHCRLFPGASFIFADPCHHGLLGGPEGEKLLAGLVLLGFAPLPGERSAQFYTACHELRREISALEALYVKALYALENDVSLAAYRQGVREESAAEKPIASEGGSEAAFPGHRDLPFLKLAGKFQAVEEQVKGVIRRVERQEQGEPTEDELHGLLDETKACHEMLIGMFGEIQERSAKHRRGKRFKLTHPPDRHIEHCSQVAISHLCYHGYWTDRDMLRQLAEIGITTAMPFPVGQLMAAYRGNNERMQEHANLMRRELGKQTRLYHYFQSGWVGDIINELQARYLWDGTGKIEIETGRRIVERGICAYDSPMFQDPDLIAYFEQTARNLSRFPWNGKLYQIMGEEGFGDDYDGYLMAASDSMVMDYRAWLKGKFRTIEELNKQWGPEHKDFGKLARDPDERRNLLVDSGFERQSPSWQVGSTGALTRGAGRNGGFAFVVNEAAFRLSQEVSVPERRGSLCLSYFVKAGQTGQVKQIEVTRYGSRTSPYWWEDRIGTHKLPSGQKVPSADDKGFERYFVSFPIEDWCLKLTLSLSGHGPIIFDDLQLEVGDQPGACVETWKFERDDDATVVMPPKRFPQTRGEFHNWFDWIQFRNERLEAHLRRTAEAIKQGDPGALISTGIDQFGPQEGVEYEKFGEILDVPGAHYTPSPDIWYHIDLRGKGQEVFNSEWKPQGHSPSSGLPLFDNIRKVNFRWNAAGMTRYGWFNVNIQMFTPHRYSGVAFHDLAEYIRRSRRWDAPLFLEGYAKDCYGSPLAIYWPYLTSRLPEYFRPMYHVMGAWDRFLEADHRPRYVLTRNRVAKGELRNGRIRVVILPEALLLPQKVIAELLDFVEKGGHLICVGRSGEMTDYAEESRAFFYHAQVVPRKVQGVAIRVGEKQYRPAPLLNGEFLSFQPLFAENAKDLLSYEDGSIAAIRTNLGQGTITFIGFDPAKDTSVEKETYPPEERTVFEVWGGALEGLPLQRMVDCDDARIRLFTYEHPAKPLRFTFVLNTIPENRPGVIIVKFRGPVKFVADLETGAYLNHRQEGEFTACEVPLMRAYGRVLAWEAKP